jgi:hypothetical protein
MGARISTVEEVDVAYFACEVEKSRLPVDTTRRVCLAVLLICRRQRPVDLDSSRDMVCRKRLRDASCQNVLYRRSTLPRSTLLPGSSRPDESPSLFPKKRLGRARSGCTMAVVQIRADQPPAGAAVCTNPH